MTRLPFLNPNYCHVESTFSLLGIGLPRTGTGYLHMLLRTFGLDVGHENARPDGTVDWQLSLRPKVKTPYGKASLDQFERGLVIRTARNPSTTIPSFIKAVVKVKPTLEYIKKHMDVKLKGLNKLEACIELMFAFEEVLDTWNPDFIVKIETDAEKLYKFLCNYYDNLCPFNQWLSDRNKFFNSNVYGRWTPEQEVMRDSLDIKWINKINYICTKLDYPPVIKTT